MTVDPASGYSMAAFRADKQQQIVQAKGIIDTLKVAQDISKTVPNSSGVSPNAIDIRV